LDDFNGLLRLVDVAADRGGEGTDGSFLCSISARSLVVTKPTISAMRANSRRQFSVSATTWKHAKYIN
jgi:hypothetical protein